jgi:glycosyltransferase domain-containing protein
MLNNTLNNAPLVGIFIPTMNRADFMIRQLEYYAYVGCPHPIYIGDSSKTDEKNKLTDAMNKFDNKLKIRLEDHTGLNVVQSTLQLLDLIDEKYTCFIGDDDLQIPSSLTKCATFLENNPDFSSVSGHAVAIRTKNNNAHGKIVRISDYPSGEILKEKPSERIIEHLKNYYVIMTYVSRTKQIRKSWQNMKGITDKALAAEMVPTLSTMISGKSKKLDLLCFIRQIHDNHYTLPDILDWITGENWRNSFLKSLDKLSNELLARENISKEHSYAILKEGFWVYMQRELTRTYYESFPHRIKKVRSKKRDFLMTGSLEVSPFLKYIYRRWIKSLKTGKRYLHYEVTQPYSSYYKDFKAIKDCIENFDE